MTFSYAQAARGVLTPSNVSSNPGSSASSELGTKDVGRDASNTIDSNSNNKSRLTSISTKMEKSSSSASAGSSAAATNAPASDVNEISNGEAKESSKPGNDASMRRSLATGLQDAAPIAVENSHEQVQHTSESGDSQDRAKEKDNDDDWEKVSIPSVAAEKEKELKAAPIPTVNVWAQRSQIQQAKFKDQGATTASKAPPVSNTASRSRHSVGGPDEARKRTPNREAASNGLPGRANSGGRAAKDQQSTASFPRSASLQNDRNAAAQSLPVDARSWPTPESAVADTGRRSSVKETADKVETVDTKPVNRKKEWTAMPFVPSVVFETQLPSGARRGGRPATRGRGGMNSQGERAADKTDANAMPPPPLPKTASDQDRGRRPNANRPARTSSGPLGNSQAATVGNASGEIGTSAEISTTSTDSPSTQEPSRSSSSQPLSVDNVPAAKPESTSETLHAGAVTASPTRQPQNENRTRPAHDNNEKTFSKEWQKDRNNNGQKGDNWRQDRRGDRPDRGRGGHRGRGANNSNYNNPSLTSPLPQNTFDSPRANNNFDGRASRQPTQGHTTGYNASRDLPRSRTTPGLPSVGVFHPGVGYADNLPPIQTHFSYGYGQMPGTLSGGAMPAMPFNTPLTDFGIVSMVVAQLEYYFSLDNLCKDMFLRKNMDSQGFVQLRVIADFRRIKALLGDNSMSYEQLRNVASQVRNIEFIVGEDGEDRLRSRENWKDFVLPVEERVPQAQNGGPKVKTSHPRHFPGAVPDFQMGNGLRSAPPHINGFHETFSPQSGMVQYHQPVTDAHAMEQWASRVENAPQDENRRTSVTSPLSQVQSPSQDAKNAFANLNGHRDSVSSNTTVKESTFPDESVAALKVVVRDPEYQGDANDSMEESASTRVSGLRGGAGSPEQFERIRGLQFGQNASGNGKRNQTAMYAIQPDGPPQHLIRPGYIWEEYLTLRDLAQKQRAEDHLDGAVLPLYPLWAEFLSVPNQFNVGMYEDFKSWALEDASKGNDNGKTHLAKFYDAMLTSNSSMSERLANDVVEIARQESGTARPTWLKLRAAWRNGATNLKTRKRLTDLLTAEEKNELERGG